MLESSGFFLFVSFSLGALLQFSSCNNSAFETKSATPFALIEEAPTGPTLSDGDGGGDGDGSITTFRTKNICSTHATRDLNKTNLMQAQDEGVSIAVYHVDPRSGLRVGAPARVMEDATRRKAAWSEMVNKKTLTLQLGGLTDGDYTLAACDPKLPKGALCGATTRDVIGQIAPFARSFFFRVADEKVVTATQSVGGAANLTAKPQNLELNILYGINGVDGCEDNYDPLAIDLSGRGEVNLSSPLDGVAFDVSGDGIKDQVSWPRDGMANAFIALDRNGNGKIDDIQELFGNNTIGPDRRRASDSFAALAKFDSNRDGLIDAKDLVFSSLVLWKDANRNGVSEAGELISITQARILSIEVKRLTAVDTTDEFGNQVKKTAPVKLWDGSTLPVFSLWLRPIWSVK